MEKKGLRKLQSNANMISMKTISTQFKIYKRKESIKIVKQHKF